jgi:hypothetical protein
MGRRDRDDENEDLGFAMGEAFAGRTWEDLYGEEHRRDEALKRSFKKAPKVRYTTSSSEFRTWCKKARVKFTAREETNFDQSYQRTVYHFSGDWGGSFRFYLERRGLKMSSFFRMNLVLDEKFVPESFAYRAFKMLKEHTTVPEQAIVGNYVNWIGDWRYHPVFKKYKLDSRVNILSMRKR